MATRLLAIFFLVAAPLTNAWTFADRLLGRAPSLSVYQHRTPSFVARQFAPLPLDQETLFTSNDTPDRDQDVLDLVETIVRAADGRKADDIVALHVAPVTSLTRYVIVCTGNSRPQNQAIANAVKKDVQDHFSLVPGIAGVPEGTAESGWMLLDYGTVMVHVMTPKSRLYYTVESQWREKGALALDLDGMLLPNAPEKTSGSVLVDEESLSQDVDPFWS
jgi:ribosome-associated protein